MRTPSFHLLTALACGLIVSNAGAQQTAAPSAAHPATSKTASSASKTGSTAKAATTVKPVTLETPKQKQSYAIGMSFAKSLQKQSVDVDPNILAQAVKDTFSGKTLLTEEQAKATLDGLQNEMRAKMEAKMKEVSDKN